MPETQSIHRFAMAAPGAGGQPMPFAKAVRAGDFVYVSGQVPMRDGEIVGNTIIDQARVTFENVRQVLEDAGCGMEDVVKVNIWLDDARDFPNLNKVFAEFFHNHPPARSTVQSLIMVDAKVEAEVIAFKPLS